MTSAASARGRDSLLPARLPVQKIEFGWKLHVGCDPRNCSHSCNKSHAGVEFDGTLARWAVPHFGQSPAGSALNAIALCLLRFMAARNPAPGERRGTSVSTGNGVVWVDDFAFWTVVRAHALCRGLEAGYPVCIEFLWRRTHSFMTWPKITPPQRPPPRQPRRPRPRPCL